jgi:peptide deformylase
MTTLTILNYPDPRLHKVAKPVLEVNDEIRRLVDDMAETMYAAPGIGLAATQVDRHIQLIVIDTSKQQNDLLVLINPNIVAKSGLQVYEEGCLSVPDVYEAVTRAEKVTVEALNKEGEKFRLDAEGLLAVCIQHEMDHLLGKVFVEYLSPLKRNRIKTKLLKHAREIVRNSY